jgi:septal ring factor EnvC (AmiA/AmiB activator)
MNKVLTIVLALLVIVGGGGVLLAQQADASEPGDTLYSVDLLAEDVQRIITFDDVKKAELEEDILGERVSELESVVEKDGDVEEILTAIEAQQEKVQKQIGKLEENPEKLQDGELEQIQNRYQQQLEQHIQVVEKVQNKGEDTAIEVKQQLEENLDSCRGGTCGPVVNDSGNKPTDVVEQSGSDNGQGAPEDAGNPNN